MCHAQRARREARADHPSTGFRRFVLITFCMVIILAVTASQPVQTIRSLTFVGNRAVPSTELLSWCTLNVGDSFSRDRLQEGLEKLRRRYEQEGFPFAAVDSAVATQELQTPNVDVTIFLSEGKPALLRSLSFEGNRLFSSEYLMVEMFSRPNERFLPRVLEEDVHAVLRRYERAGYPFAMASVDVLAFQEEASSYSVDVVVRIREGEAVRVSTLTVEGNTTTKEHVLVREARLHGGVLWAPDLPARIQQRLQRLQVFSSVALPELYLRHDSTAGLLVRVVEGSHNRMDGMVGYIPASSGAASGSLTGFVNLQFRNLFGTGRRFTTRWYRENQFTQEIELRYHEPWIAAVPVNGEVGFFQRKQDSSYVRRHYELAAEAMLSDEFRIGVVFTQADVIPSENRVGTLAQSSSKTFGGSLVYDSRDDALTPTSGIWYRTEVHTGMKRRSLAATTIANATQRIHVDAEYTTSLALRHLGYVALHAREVRSGGIEIGDLYRLGGTTTLRGYREGQFLGSRLVWTNVEYRVLLSPRSFFYLFMDAGYIATPNQTLAEFADVEQRQIGYGVGLRLDTALGLVGVSIALGQGDTFSTAKLHLRLVNEF
jgi:outer membrane protein insertion porin family